MIVFSLFCRLFSGLFAFESLVSDRFFVNRSEPVSFTVGDGNLIEGFEKAIFGLKAGDKRSILIQAKDAFGDWQEGNVQTFDRQD